jgi:hypothetical protein
MAIKVTEEDLLKFGSAARKQIEQANNPQEISSNAPEIISPNNTLIDKPMRDITQLDFILFQLACINPKEYTKLEKELDKFATQQATEKIKNNLAEIKNSIAWLNMKVK